MTDRAHQIGFSQRVRLEWLERTARLVLAGNDKEAVAGALQEHLGDKVSVGGHAERGNREKIITILMKIWLSVPSDLEDYRAAGLELLQGTGANKRTAVHWGMVMAVYPFWAAVAVQVGRLLNLQGSAVASQVQRRVREQYGERETVSRAARRVMRSFVDWKVLRETSSKGVYEGATPLSVADSTVVSWLVEAALRARFTARAPLKEIVTSPSLFPFRFERAAAERMVADSPRVELVRHGLDEDFLMLRPERIPPGSLF